MPSEVLANPSTALDALQASNPSSSGQERIGQKALGQDDFFKLLTTQLASQDPLKPMEDTAFIAQMANFSELEMTSNLTKSFAEFTSIQQFSAAHGYIGKQVALSSGEAGTVTSVERQDGETLVFLDGSNSEGHDINKIFKVADFRNAAGASNSSQNVTSSAQLPED